VSVKRVSSDAAISVSLMGVGFERMWCRGWVSENRAGLQLLVDEEPISWAFAQTGIRMPFGGLVGSK
jgi:hypothetical protein